MADISPRARNLVPALLYFLFQLRKQFVLKEIDQRDPQSVADLLDRRDRRAVVPSADDVVEGRLRDAGNG